MMPKAQPLLLDTYSGASIAYSLRKLSSTYTGNCIRVRRGSDNAETNIGFVNNVLDTASLLTFAGSASVAITTWYDQSGNGKNLTNTTALAQPLIVSSGVLLTTNGKAHVEFVGGVSQYLNNSTLSLPLINRSVFFVMKEVTRVEDSGIFGLNPASGNDFNSLTAYEFQGRNTGANRQYGAFGSSSTSYQLQKNGQATIIPQALINEIKGGSSASLYENNSLITTDNSFTEFNANSNTGFVLSARYLSSNSITNFGNNIFQEYIYWGSDQSSNRSNINSNINTYYSIY
jgi:hypothetical protein